MTTNEKHTGNRNQTKGVKKKKKYENAKRTRVQTMCGVMSTSIAMSAQPSSAKELAGLLVNQLLTVINPTLLATWVHKAHGITRHNLVRVVVLHKLIQGSCKVQSKKGGRKEKRATGGGGGGEGGA